MRRLKKNQIAFENTKNERIVVTVNNKQEKSCKNWDASAEQHNLVKVYNTVTKRSALFDYWGSKMQPDAANKNGACDAIYCIASDAALVDGNDFEFFCDSLGYDYDSRKAEKAYKDCQKELFKLDNVVGFDNDILVKLMDLGSYDYEESVENGLILE